MAVAAASLACGNAVPGSGALAERHPALRQHEPHRLSDLNPYLLPHDGSLTLFTCRWNPELPVPVGIPPDADAGERAAIADAVRGWESAIPGLRLPLVDDASDAIQIELTDGPVTTPAGPDTGNALVECRLAPLSEQDTGDRVRGAELVSARVRLARRTPPDFRGRDRPLGPDELRGAALHELGHALGYQGHAQRGSTVMVRELSSVRLAGERLAAGKGFEDSTLRALYALPSGTVLARFAVDRWRTDLVDRMARLAESHGLDGPFARVGDGAARVYWRDPKGLEYGLWVLELDAVLRDPARLLVLPEARTRSALPRSRDARPD